VYHDDVPAFVLSSPSVRNEALRDPVAGPSRQRVDLRPIAIPKGVGVLQYQQQLAIERGHILVGRLVRAPTEVRWHSHPGALELALMEEAQAWGEESDRRRRAML